MGIWYLLWQTSTGQRQTLWFLSWGGFEVKFNVNDILKSFVCSHLNLTTYVFQADFLSAISVLVIYDPG